MSEICLSEVCYDEAVRGSRYCAFHRKKVRSAMELERLRSVARQQPAVSLTTLKSTTYLYAIIAGSEAVKFGFANNVAQRMADLQTGNHLPLHVYASILCPQKLETAVHQHLQQSWLIGEWHRLDNDSKIVMNFIKKGDLKGLIKMVER